MKRLSLALLAALFSLFDSTADAANAYTQGRGASAGRSEHRLSIVMSIPPNSLLAVNGCLDDFTWCDVDWEGNHGWLYGNYLYYDYQQRRVPVIDVGAALGIGIVAFNLGDYWGVTTWVGRGTQDDRTGSIGRRLPAGPRCAPGPLPYPEGRRTVVPADRLPDRPAQSVKAAAAPDEDLTQPAAGSDAESRRRRERPGRPGGSRPIPRPSAKPAPRPSSPQPDNKAGPSN